MCTYGRGGERERERERSGGGGLLKNAWSYIAESLKNHEYHYSSNMLLILHYDHWTPLSGE